MSPDPIVKNKSQPAVLRRTVRLAAIICWAACIPSPIGAQAWTTIRAAPLAPPPSANIYQLAANRDDIRAGQRVGQLSNADARHLHRENARTAVLAVTGAGPSDPSIAFAAQAAEATHGLIVTERTKGIDHASH